MATDNSVPSSTSCASPPSSDASALPPFAPAAAPLLRVPLYPEEAAAAPIRVAVTGATGYVAGAVVARLLAAGHTVVATVRDPDNAAAVAPLRALPGAATRLHLARADLLQPGSFDAAVAGCEYVLHTASPFLVNVRAEEAVRLLVEPAVRGVENVLAAVERSPSVRRVVLTSSIAAVMMSTPEKCKPGIHSYDETEWNTTATETLLPYTYSKTLAERRAWELASRQSRWSLVALCPGLVLGPPLSSRTDSESVALMRRMMRGEMFPAAPAAGLSCVDVRDVAAAHCLAMVHPGAQGRYILTSCDTALHSLVDAVVGLYPGGAVRRPLVFAPKWLIWLLGPLAGMPRDVVQYTVGFFPRLDNSKVTRELGLHFTPLEVTLRDMIEDLAARGIIVHPKPSTAVPAAAAAVAAGSGQ